MVMRFDVEVSGPEKDEEMKSYLLVHEATALVRKMKDGDALVINAREEPDGAL